MNSYFNHFTNIIASGIRALSAQVNNIGYEIGLGFDKLPTEAQLKQGTTRYAADTGAADAYVVTLPHTTVLNDGMRFSFKAVNANTGASTVNVNALGIRSIVYADDVALGVGAIAANQILEVAYSTDLGKFVVQSLTPNISTLVAAYLAATNQDTIDTAADVVSTNADVVSTNADAVSTDADVTYSSEWAIAVEDTPVSVAAGGDNSTTFSALHWAAKSAVSATLNIVDNSDDTFLTVDASENAAFAGNVDVDGTLTVGDGSTSQATLLLDSAGSNLSKIEFSETGTVRASISYIGATNDLYFRSGDSNTLALTLDSSQNATFAGNVIMGSGSGIDFSATADGSGTTTSELLDFYEEGTWTPTVSDGANSATLLNEGGIYTRIGNMVFITGHFTINSLASMTGNVRINGLPFTCGNQLPSVPNGGGTVGVADSLNITAGESVVVSTGPGQTWLDVKIYNAATGTGSLVASELSVSGALSFSLSHPA